jgi:serine protease Do
MENLTRTQIIFLVLLVSFVVSVATGIVTVTLVNQAPPPLTHTISKIIEKVTPKGTIEIQQPEVVQQIAETREELIIKTVKNVSSAVVSIIATKDVPVLEEYYANPLGGDPFFQQFFGDVQIPQYRQKGTEKKQISSGTGFFVSADGLIITNKHVVQDAEAEYTAVTNNGDKLKAKVLVKDPFQDIAILKIDGDKFNYIPLGDSNNIKIGQTAIAIGNSLGEFQNTISVGIISGLGRNIVASGETLQGLIQTDAAINAGNSGGPLLNLSGQVIGVNTAMASGAENMGFALPINIAKRDIQDTKEFGKINYPFIGIRYQVVDSSVKKEKNLAFDYGLLLVRGANSEPAVAKDSPAEKSGLKEGDIVLEYNGTKLDKASTLSSLLSKGRVGDKISLKSARDGKEMTVELTLGERPENL